MQPQEKLGGIVEVDETYVGGKDKNRHWDKKNGTSAAARKTPVIGAVQRKGNVVARVLSRCYGELRSHISSGGGFGQSFLARDGRMDRIQRTRLHIRHASVDHHKHQYVVGAVHTNTIEGFWSIFKRGVVGTFHKVSAKYLPLYVAEFQFRYNNRSNGDIFGAVVSGC